MAANHQNDPASNNQEPSAGPPPIDRLRHIGAVPARASYAPSYSAYVRRLRVLLPVIGVLTVGLVILWPRIRAQFNRPTETSAEERQARMINGRYVGSDSHGRPYTITYESAQQAPGGGPVEMVDPVAELTLENGRWVAVKAARGHYDQAAGVVDLLGKVELFHDQGYRFTTERAHVEFTKNLVWGDRAVTGRGPKGDIAGRGFRVVNNGASIIFTGPARMVLRPDAAQILEPGEAP